MPSPPKKIPLCMPWSVPSISLSIFFVAWEKHVNSKYDIANREVGGWPTFRTSLSTQNRAFRYFFAQFTNCIGNINKMQLLEIWKSKRIMNIGKNYELFSVPVSWSLYVFSQPTEEFPVFSLKIDRQTVPVFFCDQLINFTVFLNEWLKNFAIPPPPQWLTDEFHWFSDN